MKAKRIEIKENAKKLTQQRSFWGEENKREESLTEEDIQKGWRIVEG